VDDAVALIEVIALLAVFVDDMNGLEQKVSGVAGVVTELAERLEL
tara:strand:- start:6 stop:140 length:135 start_codon:yes stop_codon:yes gene_type:complete